MPYRPPNGPEKYRNEVWLREQYHKENRSAADIADECSCSKETIRRWLNRHGIGTRDRSEAAIIRSKQHPHTLEAGAEALSRNRSNHANILTHKQKGYEVMQCGVVDEQLHHHRLLATLLVDDLSELEGMHVHHKDRIPWLNYLGGLEVLTPKEHKARHVE